MTSPESTPVPVPVTLNPRRIRLRRAWAQEWRRSNPILSDGEPGFDKTHNMLKMGDGVTPWNDLEYLTPSGSGSVEPGDPDVEAIIARHVEASNPHPVYDDGPSLVLLYMNAKV